MSGVCPGCSRPYYMGFCLCDEEPSEEARRAELIDLDCCPDCGAGGGHDAPWECRSYVGDPPTEQELRDWYGEEEYNRRKPPSPERLEEMRKHTEQWIEQLNVVMAKLATGDL